LLNIIISSKMAASEWTSIATTPWLWRSRSWPLFQPGGALPATDRQFRAYSWWWQCQHAHSTSNHSCPILPSAAPTGTLLPFLIAYCW